MKAKTGTREWSQRTVNLQRGCEHNCRYCYARAKAIRFKRCTAEEWSEPVINQRMVDKAYRKLDGVTMFPSTHDITPHNVVECLNVLDKLLRAGNQVLIVTKPGFASVEAICTDLAKYKQQILFRFTIGSGNDDVLKFWEPGAPPVTERFAALKYAYDCGFKTSVSCEPYLDEDMCILYDYLERFVTDCIWIGILRNFNSRVDLAGVSDYQKGKFLEPLKAAQTDEAVRELYAKLDGKPLVKWKDSIREIMSREYPK